MNMQTAVKNETTRETILRIMSDARWRTMNDLINASGLSISGVNRAVREAVADGLLKTDRGGCTQTLIYRSPTVKPRAKAKPVCTEESWLEHMPLAGTTGNFNYDHPKIPASWGDPKETQAHREALMLPIMRKHGPMNAREIAEHCEDLTKDQVMRALIKLREVGQVRKIGASTETKWELME